MIYTLITIEDLFEVANRFTPKHKRAYQRIVADFTNVPKEKREKEIQTLNEILPTNRMDRLIDDFSCDDWINATMITDLFNPFSELEKLKMFTPKQRTILAIKKLKKEKENQFTVWDTFVSQFDNESIKEEIARFSDVRKRTPLDSHYSIKISHVLEAAREQISQKSNIQKKHVVAWVFGLLAEKRGIIKLYHLSDTISPLDTAQQRIQAHYNILEKKYWVKVEVEFHGSSSWRSFQTWAQAMQIIGQSTEIALDKHNLKSCPKLFIMVNNASRWKHTNKRKAQWSRCMWARVQDQRSKVVHEIIWVDNDVFSVFKSNILELFVIEWMEWDPHYGDLSKWSQFRSMHNFPYVQFLNAISEWWSPAGFRVKKVNVDEEINDFIIEKDEVVLLDPDHYGNWKSLSIYKNWIFGLCKALWAKPDKDTIIWDFFDPDTWEQLYSIEFIATEYLGRHTWKKCIWNWSSKTIDWSVLIELWISKKWPEDIVPEILSSPIWTRVKFRKKVALSC